MIRLYDGVCPDELTYIHTQRKEPKVMLDINLKDNGNQVIYDTKRKRRDLN